MSAADRFRAAADRGRRAVDALGLRPTTVRVVVEQWPGAFDPQNGAPVTTTATPLVPTPKVAVTAWADSVFGGGQAAGGSSRRVAASVTIGPITPAYAGGGFDAATLDPSPSDPSQRVYLLLAGGAFDAAGEKFLVTRKDTGRALHTTLYADRTEQ